ncbi:MAG TPA: methyltransferase domain-containing protein [Bryobacteraceae bacterium]|nr:methyltransferase domain-containing protein [Bryobacteraceae bacterium]
MRNGRVLRSERLETATPLVADQNLRDLVRINRWFGGHRVLLHVFEKLVHPLDRFSVLDVGAASGDAGRRIKARYRSASVVSLDRRLSHLGPAESPRVTAEASALPFRERSFDFVLCSLLLHHFSDGYAIALVAQLRRFARQAVIVLDLERHPAAYGFLPLTRFLFNWSELTIHDGCISVAASFTEKELASIAKRAGADNALIHRHWPWFRISVVIPSESQCRGASSVQLR